MIPKRKTSSTWLHRKLRQWRWSPTFWYEGLRLDLSEWWYMLWQRPSRDIIRCRIVNVDGTEFAPGCFRRTPEISRPHIGKEGIAEYCKAITEEGEEFDTVQITLDDGTVLYGFECWWEPL